MDDDLHMYEAIGYQEGGHKLHDRAERVTSFDNRQKYMTLHHQQKEGPSEYQEPYLHTRDTRAAVNTEVKGSSDCGHVQKDELKQMKRCICTLSFLVAILFLITVLSLGLAAYGFGSTGSTAGPNSQFQKASLDGIVNSTEFVDIHSFTLFKDQLSQEMMQIQENNSIYLRNVIAQLDSCVNITNREVTSLTSLRMIVSELDSRLNALNSDLTSQRTLFNTLESRFNTTNVQSLAVLVTRIVNDTLFSGLLDDAIQRQFGKSAIHTSLGCLMMLFTLLNVSLVKSFFFFLCVYYLCIIGL